MEIFLIITVEMIFFIFGLIYCVCAQERSLQRDVKAFGKFRINEKVYEAKEM